LTQTTLSPAAHAGIAIDDIVRASAGDDARVAPSVAIAAAAIKNFTLYHLEVVEKG